MEILELWRSHVLVQLHGKTARVQCEMLIEAPGLSDFVIYKDTLQSWQPPFENEPLDDATKTAIIDGICKWLTSNGRHPEVE